MFIKRYSIRDSLPKLRGRLADISAKTTGGPRPIRRKIAASFGAGIIVGCLIGLLFVFMPGVSELRLRGKLFVITTLHRIKDVRGWIDSKRVETRYFNIDISFMDYQWLAYNRELAFERGVIIQNENSYVPARIELPDRTVNVKMRLKGDQVLHMEDDKWSFRIRVRGDDAVYGMKLFSIQDPLRSNFAYEWVWHEIMRREGVVAPRYDFIDVSINGKAMGIYALEESFSPEMLEANHRREGPIVKFNEAFLYAKDHIQDNPDFQSELVFTADVDAFYSSKTASDPVLRQQFEMARDLLEGFRNQRIPVDQAFDLGKTATYFALIDLCSAYHATRWKNIRFYYNPATSLLEPIPYNAYTSSSPMDGPPKPTEQLGGQFKYDYSHIEGPWMNAFFKDPTFYGAYVRELDRISRPEFIDAFFSDIEEPLSQKLLIIQRGDPFFQFSEETIRTNAETIRRSTRVKLPIRVQFDPGELSAGAPRLHIANTLRLAIRPIAVVDKENNTKHPFKEDLIVAAKRGDVLNNVALLLPESARESFAEYADGRFAVAYSVLGLSDEHTSPILRRRQVATTNLPQRLAEKSKEIFELNAFEADEGTKAITIKTGKWLFDETVYVPPGYVLLAGPGVTIDLRNGASLISYSPLRLTGTIEQPVVIQSEDGTGGGVAVVSAGEQSILEHVWIHNLAGPLEGAWTTTGALTTYESPIHIADCRFSVGRSEDLVNIIRSNFIIERSKFLGTQSDALDVDFGDGTVRDCTFERIGNDAIDVSGARVTIDNCGAEGIGDKALSIGEASEAQVNDIELRDCRYGVVSKDLSTVTAKRVTISGAEVAIVACQKKPEYGPASITIEQLRTERTPEQMWIEKGSWAIIDGHRHNGVRLNVAAVIYGE